MWLERFLLGALSLLLLLAPLPFGAVEVGWSAALVTVSLLLGVLWLVWRARRGLPALPWREPILIAGGLFICLGIVQMIPMPVSLLESLSPEAAALRSEYEPAAAPPGEEGNEEPAHGSSWRPLSLYPWATRQAVLRILAYLVMALIASDLAATGAARTSLAWALVAGGSFQAVYGLAEYFSGHQHIFGYVKKYGTNVATGTFINRNHLAGYLEMTVPFALALGAMALARARARGGASLLQRFAAGTGRNLFIATSLLLLAFTMMTALVCSRSRMGMVSAVLSLLAVGVYLAWSGQRRGFAVAAVVVGGATLLLFSQGGGGPILERFLAAPEQLTAGVGRWSVWSQAIRVFASYPLLGVGLGSFQHVFAAFRTEGEGVALTHAHNDLLELAAETGAVGCALLVVGAFLLVRSLVRCSRDRPGFGHLGPAAAAGVLALGFHSLTDFNLAIPGNALTLSVIVGLLVAWRRAPAPVLAVDHVGRGRALRGVWAPSVIFLFSAFLASGPLVGEMRSEGGSPDGAPTLAADSLPVKASPLPSLLFDGDNALRLQERARALARPPMEDLNVLLEVAARGEIPSQTAVDYVARRLAGAVTIQEVGLRRHPASSRAHLALGRLRAGLCTARALTGGRQQGCAEEAAAAFRAALRLNPMSAATHARVARFYIRAWPLLGDRARSEAVPILTRALSMNPEDAELREASLALQGRAAPGPS